MRIIAGSFSSRKLKTLAGTATRPTLDKVREAVFSSLGGSFSGGSFLDLYAGSGAVGLEALSRGMDTIVFCDKNRAAVSIIKENINALDCGEQCRVLNMSDVSALHLLAGEGRKFDLVYLDPPYRKQKNEEILRMLAENGLLSSGSRVVVEALKEDPPLETGDVYRIRKEAVYGITRITYYDYMEGETL